MNAIFINPIYPSIMLVGLNPELNLYLGNTSLKIWRKAYFRLII
jgi:hypothetical protein